MDDIARGVLVFRMTHGALRRVELRVGGTTVLSQALVRDSIGRLTASGDSSATGAVTTGYHYDALDRLDRVQRDGVTAQAFTYDLAGNRVSTTSAAGIVTATFAADDRILTYNGTAITHDAAGARLTEQRGAIRCGDLCE